jgi:hypothetical protein
LSWIYNEENDPWEPPYDKIFNLVIRAKTEDDARKIADENAADENEDGDHPWLDPKYSKCKPLGPRGRSEVIVKGFSAR